MLRSRVLARLGDRGASGGLLGVTSLAAAASQVIRVKIFAVAVGAAGLGLISQVSTVQTLVLSAAPLYSGASLVAALSFSPGDDARRELLAAARGLALVTSTASVLLAVVLIVPLSMAAPAVSFLVIVGILGVPFGALALVEQYAMQQEGAFGRLSAAQVAAAIGGLLVTAVLTLGFGVPGACAGLALSSVVAWSAAGIAARRSPLNFSINLQTWRRIAHFGVGLLASSVVVSGGEVAIRAISLATYGAVGTGLVHALLGLSLQVPLLVIAALNPYAQRKIAASAAAGDRDAIRRELATLQRIATLLGGSAIVALVVLREPVVAVLLAPDFALVADLLPLQLVAEIVRLQSLTAGQYLIPMGYRRWFVGPTAVSYAVIVALVLLFAQPLGLFAVPLAQVGGALVSSGAVVYHAWTRLQYRPVGTALPFILTIAGIVGAWAFPPLGAVAIAAALWLLLGHRDALPVNRIESK